MDHPYTRLDRILRRIEAKRATFDLHVTAIGRFQAVKYPHERRLTRTVFAQHRMHFALAQIEVHVDVGFDASVGLVDPGRPENDIHAHASSIAIRLREARRAERYEWSRLPSR